MEVEMIVNLFKAWQAGQELANPAKWKKGAILTNLVGAVLLGIVSVIKAKFPEFELPIEVQDYAVEVICGILAIANIYVHKASSKKV
jgi:hypothetical protein